MSERQEAKPRFVRPREGALPDVTFTRPPEGPVKVRRSRPVTGVRWRSAEERREAKRKIAAIRREAEAQKIQALRLDMSFFRSPRFLLGLLLFMLALGGLLVGTVRKPPPPKVDRTPYLQGKARGSVQAAAQAMTFYRVHTGGWPPQRLGLFALAKDYHVPGWKGPYINWAWKDPWDSPYVYRMPDSPFEPPELFSCGPDRLPDTNDDIRAMPEDFVCPEGTWRREPPSDPPSSATPAETEPKATP